MCQTLESGDTVMNSGWPFPSKSLESGRDSVETEMTRAAWRCWDRGQVPLKEHRGDIQGEKGEIKEDIWRK